MELDDIRLDDDVFHELLRTCDLEPHWRPQARFPLAPGQRASAAKHVSVEQLSMACVNTAQSASAPQHVATALQVPVMDLAQTPPSSHVS